MGNTIIHDRREEIKQVCKIVNTKMGIINLKNMDKEELKILNALCHYLYEKEFDCEINGDRKSFRSLYSLKNYLDIMINILGDMKIVIKEKDKDYDIPNQNNILINFDLEYNDDNNFNIDILKMFFCIIYNMNYTNHIEDYIKINNTYKKYLDKYDLNIKDLDKISYYYMVDFGLFF
jgi:hypothetical protein